MINKSHNLSYKVAAIIVCYNPETDDLIHSIYQLENQCNHIFVIDNSDKLELIKNLETILSNFNRLDYIPLFENKGIAYAQNIGLELAFKSLNEFSILLDQDSVITPSLINELVFAYNDLLSNDIKVACIGPQTFNRDTKIKYQPMFRKLTSNGRYQKVPAIISSGKLVSMNAYKIIGGFDVGLFIDLVDFDWCFKASALGYSTFISTSTYMGHRVGDGDINVFGLFKIPKSKPIRHYYQTRNTIFLLFRKYIPFKFKLRGITLIVFSLAIFPVLYKPRLIRLKFLVHGFIDGFMKIDGKYKHL